VGVDQRVQRLQCDGAGAGPAGQRREAELHAFAGMAPGLPVQRLVLSELLEEHCHVAAFEAMGGVPEEFPYDRMKAAVIGAESH
jgi:hypothetical protein